MLRVEGVPKEPASLCQVAPSVKKMIIPLNKLRTQILKATQKPIKGLSRGFTFKEVTMMLEEVAKNEITFQKSELRRNLTYLSNRLLLEINRCHKEGSMNSGKLQSIVKNELLILANFLEMLELGSSIDPTGTILLSPTKTEKRIPRKDKRHRLQIPNADNEQGFNLKEALEEVGLHKASGKLSLNYLGRSFKEKPSLSFLHEQAVHRLVHCLLDIMTFAKLYMQVNLARIIRNCLPAVRLRL